MSLLLDTHVLLWWLADDDRLGAEARSAIEDAGRMVHVSAATVWEISIKRQRGKLEVPGDLLAQIDESFHPLDITAAHADRAGSLPPVHADPFDRLLVAQAQLEDLELCTGDRRLPEYDVRVLPAR